VNQGGTFVVDEELIELELRLLVQRRDSIDPRCYFINVSHDISPFRHSSDLIIEEYQKGESLLKKSLPDRSVVSNQAQNTQNGSRKRHEGVFNLLGG
jgi:hypothetical protein